MGGGGGYAARLDLLFSFPCSADHERDWPPCKVIFPVGNQYAECKKQQQQRLLSNHETLFFIFLRTNSVGGGGGVCCQT